MNGSKNDLIFKDCRFHGCSPFASGWPDQPMRDLDVFTPESLAIRLAKEREPLEKRIKEMKRERAMLAAANKSARKLARRLAVEHDCPGPCERTSPLYWE